MLGAIESASFYAEQGSFERALQQYRQALVFAPHEESLRLEAARSAQMAGVPAQALELLSESRLNGPAAECLVFQSEFELADPGRLTGLATTGPAGCNVPLEIIQAKLDRAYKSGDLQLAESLAWHWARLEPESPQAWTRLAIIRVLLDPEQAAASLQQAVELVPGSPMMLDLLADLQVAQNSERSFQFARLGQTFSRHEMWFEAALAFNKALELEPKYVEARAFYGLALDRGGGDGLAELEAAYRAAPQAALPAAFLGLHWLEQDEPERALIYLQRALEREPDNPGHHAQYGAALAEAGDLQSARSAVEESTRLAQAWDCRRPGEPIFSIPMPSTRTCLGMPTCFWETCPWRLASSIDPWLRIRTGPKRTTITGCWLWNNEHRRTRAAASCA
jgi:tetratricopeptide (TPR) repeat protein